MKKIVIILLTGIMLTTGAMAQTKHVKDEQKVLKNTIKDKKEDRREAGNDLAKLKVKSSLKGRREVRHHRKSIRQQNEHLENEGVRKPIKKAKHQIKHEKELKKDKDKQ